MRILVDTRKRACQDKQQRESEEREQRAAEERRKIEEQEKLQREIDERARREQRLVKIKRDQEMAKKKAALNSVMVGTDIATHDQCSNTIIGCSPYTTGLTVFIRTDRMH